MYIDAAYLLFKLGASELAGTIGARMADTPDETVLAKVIRADAVSGIDSALLETARQAVTLINLEIDEAAKSINGYLAGRYDIPLSTPVIEQSPLRGVAYHLVKYAMNLLPDDQTITDRKYAIDTLRDIASGKIQLGEKDPAQPAQSGAVVVGRSRSQWRFEDFGR